MLARDDKNSVLCEVSRDKREAIAYSPYGYSTGGEGALGYNGERRETPGARYLLGNGYRVFSPFLMRFHSPDSWSPFGNGGLNAYMYVMGNPVGYTDPTGHMPLSPVLKSVAKITKFDPASSAAARLASNTAKILAEEAAAVSVKATAGSTRTLAKVAVNQSDDIARASSSVSKRPPMPPPKPVSKSHFMKNPENPVGQWVVESSPDFKKKVDWGFEEVVVFSDTSSDVPRSLTRPPKVKSTQPSTSSRPKQQPAKTQQQIREEQLDNKRYRKERSRDKFSFNGD